MADLKHSYSNPLRVLRRQHGLLQKQAAAIIGHKSRTMLSQYESGHVFPPSRVLIKLGILYDADVATMFPDYYRQLEAEVIRAQTDLSLHH